MDNKMELINFPFDNNQLKILFTQVIQMGEEIRKEKITNLDELDQARERITTWRKYIINMLEKILKPSIVLSQASGELINVKFNNNNGNLEQGKKEIINNINEILRIISKLRENISAISKNQQKGKEELISKFGKSIPKTDKALLIRTDYSNEEYWRSLNEIVQNPGNYFTEVEIVNNKKLESANLEEIMALVQNATKHTFMFIVDSIAINHPEKPILVVDLFTSPGQSFRIVASKLWLVINNLSIANLGFEDFKENVDKENIYRG
jgi:hypothetical protein